MKFIGFSEDGYCNSCGTHWDNVSQFKGCDSCRSKKDEKEEDDYWENEAAAILNDTLP